MAYNSKMKLFSSIFFLSFIVHKNKNIKHLYAGKDILFSDPEMKCHQFSETI